MNPYNLAIYHNDEVLLTRFLKEHDLPYDKHGDFSVIEYSFRQGHPSLIKTLCDTLYYKQRPIYLSCNDFRHLIQSNLKEGHKLISKALINLECFENFNLMYLPEQVRILFNRDLSDFFLKAKQIEHFVYNRNKQLLLKNRLKNEDKKSALSLKGKKSKQMNFSHVSLHSTPFEYDFSLGTLESLMFLDCYSKSKSDKLVISEWRHLIELKWGQVYLFNLLIALMYWSFMVIVTLKIVFLERGVYLMNISIVLIFIFFVIEFLQFLSFATFKISLYFFSIWNWIDMILYSSLIFFYYNQLSMSQETHRVIGSLILIVIFYRGFSYLKMIKTFTSMVGIIDTVIKKMMVFLIILF